MNRKKILSSLDRALDHHKKGDIEQAARLYAEVCRAAPKFFDAWYLAGTLAFHRGGHLTEAIDLLSRALRLDPRSAKCKLFLGMALADAGRHAEAEKPLAAALREHPNYPEAWENMANIHLALGRTEPAINCLRRATELAPAREDLRQRLDELAATVNVPTSTISA